MRSTRMICTAAVAVAVGAMAATTPALASGLTLELQPPPQLVVGHPAFVRASGTIPPQDREFSYWFSLDAIPTAVTGTCPADRFEGAQVAQSTGGGVIVLSQRENPGADGAFSIRVGITPTAPGSVLLCGYTDDGEATTLASASSVLHIRASGQGGSGTGIPSQARAAVRSCNAVLGPRASRRCVRHALGIARKQCRRLPGHARQAECLRGVRRAGRAS